MNKIMKYLMIVIVLAAVTVQASAQTVVAPTKENVDRLTNILKSDSATRHDKTTACRELSIIGSPDSIDTLAGLLADEEMNHMARYALEPIDSKKVDDVFLKALGELNGNRLVGVIGSCGVRRDPRFAPVLSKMLTGDNSDVVKQAAARALGFIGGRQAASRFAEVLPGVSKANRLAFCEGALRCAEGLAEKGETARSAELYAAVLHNADAHQVKTACVRGLILTAGNQQMKVFEKYLENPEYLMFAAAIRTSFEMKDDRVVPAIAASLKNLDDEKQILAIQALGTKGDSRALGTLEAIAADESKPVRIAAIRSIAELQDDSAVDTLVKLYLDSDSDISGNAREALVSILSPKVDAAIIRLFQDASTRKAALELMERRRMTNCVDLLFAQGAKAEPLRSDVVRLIGTLGSQGDLDKMIALFMSLSESSDLSAAERAIRDLSTKTASDSEQCMSKIAALMEKASPDQKVVIVKILGAVKGSNALAAVRKAVDSTDDDVRQVAVRSLCTWNTEDVISDLFKLAKSGKTDNEKTVCMRAYLQLAGRDNIPQQKRLAMLKDASNVIESDGEKRMLLGALGKINSMQAVNMIAPYLERGNLKEEACSSLVSVAGRLLEKNNNAAAKLKAPLTKVMEMSKNANLVKQAKELLKK